MNSGARKLDWDLSGGHSTKDVAWPNDLDAFALEGGVRVKVTLPQGRIFEDNVEKVMGLREGEIVRNLDFFYPPTSTGEAYERAKRLGAQWQVDLRNIDQWYQRRLEQRENGRENYSDTAFTGAPHSEPLGGSSGPRLVIEVLNSFDEPRPVVVNLTLEWPRSG